MKLIPQEKLNKALDKALLKHRPLKSEISLFKAELVKLIGRIDNSEREEFILIILKYSLISLKNKFDILRF